MSGIGAVLEERGLARGISMQQEVLPEEGNRNLRRFSDVKGCDEAKDELIEIVEYLKAPQKFTRLGGKLPKGVLLVGPPGTGKTLLARAIAGEAGVPFFYASGSEFEEMFVGVGARRVRELFNAAKKRAPCIVFIDEIDAIGGKRNPKDQMYMKMTLNQLLVELDGFSSTEGIIVIGATNFPESLDKALIRPGRFDRHVIVPNPDVRGREEILSLHTEKIPLADDVNLEILARSTPGFSGAELANLVNMAALKAAREGASLVTMENFEFAKDKIIMGAERRSAVISEDNRRLTAYHESGHALVAIFTDGAFPVHKATIVPRGIALGMVAQLPDKDMTSMSRKQMLAKLDVCMGGRAAEELIFGPENVTNGAESDFEQATELAEAMVTRFGMSQKVGHMAYDTEREVHGEMLHIVEREVKQFLDESYQRARQVLLTHEKELHRLAAALLERETLNREEIVRIVKGDRLTDKRTHEAAIEPDEAALSDSGSLAENVAARARGAVAAAAAKAGVPRPGKVPAPAKTV
jgi:ATP-dependent metalloprotease